MKKIVCIIGESATGKTEIEKRLQKYGIKKIVSYTTRKPRDGEINGVDYHFITNKEFDKLEKEGHLVEKTMYKVNNEEWRYGFSKESFEIDEIGVAVMNPSGLSQLMTNVHIRDYLMTIHITSNLEDRIKRYLGRESDSNTEFDGNLAVKLIQRVLADIEDFRDNNFAMQFIRSGYAYFTVENNGMDKNDLDGVVNKVLKIISSYKSIGTGDKNE